MRKKTDGRSYGLGPSVSLFTDASLDPCTGHGGYAVVDSDTILSGGCEYGTTVTRLEGKAIVAALRLAQSVYHNREVHIYTDAAVWAVRYSQLETLARNDWRKPTGKSVKEADLLQQMWSMYTDRVEVHWVRGHNGHIGNTFADQMAKEVRLLGVHCGILDPQTN